MFWFAHTNPISTLSGKTTGLGCCCSPGRVTAVQMSCRVVNSRTEPAEHRECWLSCKVTLLEKQQQEGEQEMQYQKTRLAFFPPLNRYTALFKSAGLCDRRCLVAQEPFILRYKIPFDALLLHMWNICSFFFLVAFVSPCPPSTSPSVHPALFISALLVLCVGCLTSDGPQASQTVTKNFLLIT